MNTCHASVKDSCERFLFEQFGEKVKNQYMLESLISWKLDHTKKKTASHV